jgi:quercetin dioxygenase-like cupin family protein
VVSGTETEPATVGGQDGADPEGENFVSAREATAIMRYAETKPDRFREGWQRRIAYTDKLMIVVIDVENGPWAEPDPPHSHPHEQVAYVVSGEVMFICEDAEPQRLQAGDVYAIPPNKQHTIQLLSKTARLVDVFHPLREEFLP